MEYGKSTLNVITPVCLSDAHPAHPIVGPGDDTEGGLPPGGGEQPPVGGHPHPSHPIYYPDYPSGEYPAHPIVLPPPGGGETPPIPETPGLEMKVGWTEETGWVVVFVPTGAHVAPSAA